MDYTVAMQHAIALAEKGLGKTAPNPIVGAVIIDLTGAIVAEGFHDRMSSTDHAEVVALKAAGSKARGLTMVVTLEPCNHTGSTGPCAQAIIEAGIATVVYAVKDPNAKAAGGADALREAGISVVEGVLKDEAAYSNRAWLMKIRKNRPFLLGRLQLLWMQRLQQQMEHRSGLPTNFPALMFSNCDVRQMQFWSAQIR
jgi:diaminohydroxyphosphoribosylaminopyrimidine deaminase/5-amino-6-(5-phosphoribosylamino)uracil reductase